MKRALHYLLALALILAPSLAHAWGWGWGHTPPASNSVRTAGGGGSGGGWSESIASATAFWVDHDSAVIDGDDSGAGFGLAGADVLFDAMNGVAAVSGGSRAMDGVDAAIVGPNAVSAYVVSGSQTAGKWGMAWRMTHRGKATTYHITRMVGTDSARSAIQLDVATNGTLEITALSLDGITTALEGKSVSGAIGNGTTVNVVAWADGTTLKVGWTTTNPPVGLSDFGANVKSTANNGTWSPSNNLFMAGAVGRGTWGRTDGDSAPAVDAFGFGAWANECPIDNSL